MKLSSIISLSVFVAVTSGCALNPSNNTLVVLQHPDTKETKECKAGTWALWNASAEVEACVKTYEKSGFKKTGTN
jgi:hypothetical protein